MDMIVDMRTTVVNEWVNFYRQLENNNKYYHFVMAFSMYTVYGMCYGIIIGIFDDFWSTFLLCTALGVFLGLIVGYVAYVTASHRHNHTIILV